MAKALRWLGYVLVFILLVLVLVAAWIWFASERAISRTYQGIPEKLAAASPAMLADGPRQLKVLGCISCHGEGLRGQLMFDEPGIATIHAPNLTLLADKASDQQLAQALRQGIGIDGRPLFIMPSSQYARLTDGETAALVAAVRAMPRGGTQTPPIAVGPRGRVGLALGKLSDQPSEVRRFKANMPADLGARFAKGRHLAMVNCAECHGPAFGGGEPKPGLKALDLQVAGVYDLREFERLLRTGVPTGNRKLGLMADVSRNDFRHFNEEEIAAVHAYLVQRANRMH